ncbi:3-oxoacyl-[acyl-carrier-protein] synthase III C-terminal domain-containing protein [Allocoleopsis franciscana]|uniref:3-oxoacyl-(Acyl-carrier-protein) synthase III n=1 Tax=Allocoleopsis franciscana PCC 7113 TaxID=1173027 RepID=K9WB78_9CYAN|nr:3-oxoacyl-[acyl-carrier-protein] synthase III C-terminal domain-containing protein [Allocoleopsis franciscana]AFZ17615.1 3-oxoacyl-(acyl-carrier-protein) synthase III [Allocoleopsis franciscana PCC 7113]
MTSHSIGIRSLAVSFPSLIRTNDYWYEKFPELAVQAQPKRVRLPRTSQSTSNDDGIEIWSQEVAPYLNDPFRGNVERRVLSHDESPLTLEYRAAKEALEAANLHPEEVELAICASQQRFAIATSLFCEPIGLSNTSSLVRQLNLHCPAWNLESTCSSALVALQNARALVQTGEYRNVLVVVSQFGSNTVDDEDTLSWSMGDGAGAFVVSALKPNQGVLGTKIISTTATCGAYSHELVTDAQGVPRMRTRTGENASMLAETAVDFVRTCCKEAATAAGVSLEGIDFFAFNTPTAWYASVCTRALGIDPERTINLYPRYANIGPVLPIANLYHATRSGKLRENDLVLVYTNGAGATAGAMVMRWGDVALGAVPAPPISVTPEQEKIRLAGADSRSQENPPIHQTETLSREQLLAAEPEKRRQMLETYLIGWLTTTLQLPPNQFTPQQSFASLLDSLMALMFRSRIETDLQVQVPMESFFGDNTIAQLSEQLLNQLVLVNLIATEPIDAAKTHEEEREKLSL